jgi:hypothetical protein
LHALHGATELGLDLSTAPFVGPVPRYMIRMFAKHLAGWIAAILRGRSQQRAEHFCMLAYVIGYARESLRGRARQATPASTITAH